MTWFINFVEKNLKNFVYGMTFGGGCMFGMWVIANILNIFAN